MPATADIAQPTLLEFPEMAQPTPGKPQHWTARGQNFQVTWYRAATETDGFDVASEDEAMLMVLDGTATLSTTGTGATASPDVSVPPRSIAILPPGTWHVRPAAGVTCTAIVSLREGAGGDAINETAYAERDTRIRGVGKPYTATRGAGTVRILPIDEVQASKDKPRLKMLQTATLSINWVEYDGPRDRTALSPHAHTDFEQGSFGLAGDFVHHLRAPWAEDANTWQEDRHALLRSPSLMVVPVNLIHTSEGVGPGRHLLIDVFSPPRADFIAKGWVYNSGDYSASAERA